MQQCEQTAGQSILDHGLSVWEQLRKIIKDDTSGMRLPQWYASYKDQILASIQPSRILEQYATYHDCGFLLNTLSISGESSMFNCKVCLKEVRTSRCICKSCSLKRAYAEGRVPDKTGANNPAFGTTMESRINDPVKFEAWKRRQTMAKTGSKNSAYGKVYENSGKSVKGWYEGLFFRSTYELAFIIGFEMDTGYLPKQAEGKVLIKLDNGRTYTPDFQDLEGNIFEIKPSRFVTADSVVEKTTAAISYCNERGLTYTVVTERDLPQLPPEHKRKSWVLKLVETGKVVLTQHSNIKWSKGTTMQTT